MSEPIKRRAGTKMVPYPSQSIVPERDLNVQPVLETRHLGIEFGGLKAVDDFVYKRIGIVGNDESVLRHQFREFIKGSYDLVDILEIIEMV